MFTILSPPNSTGRGTTRAGVFVRVTRISWNFSKRKQDCERIGCGSNVIDWKRKKGKLTIQMDGYNYNSIRKKYQLYA